MNQMMTCELCGAAVRAFTPQEEELAAVVRALSNGSKTIAAAELKYFAQCTDDQAKAWIDHLLSCVHAWPHAQADELVLKRIDQAFSGALKPDHFTDFSHCDECKEHDDTLRGRTRETLRRQDLGNPGWDPMTFSRADGIGYFFPSLARFALLPDVWRDHDWYADQLLSHLSWDGENNRFLAWCSPHQRAAVLVFLEHFSGTRKRAIAHRQSDEDLRNALAVWQTSSP